MDNQFSTASVPLSQRSILEKKPVVYGLIALGLLVLYLLVSKVFFKPVLITINSASEMKVAPEKALFSITTLSVDSSAQRAMSSNKQLNNNLIAVLTKNGILDKDISYSYPEVLASTTQGNYQAMSTINVSLDDISALDRLVSELYSAGAANVSEVYFTVNNPEEMEKKVIDLALKKAKKRAGEIARSSGKLFGFSRVVSVTSKEVGEVASSGGDIYRLGGSINTYPSLIAVKREVTVVFEVR